MLLGPSGVGLVGLFTSLTNLVGTLSGLGIATSGVREVAEAFSSGDTGRVARVIKTLRRSCWATGMLGWLLTIALAYPLSVWTFGSNERALAIAFLGAALMADSINGGQTALLRGVRRIGDLARLNVLSVFSGTVGSVLIYAWLGELGIVPAMILAAMINLVYSWWFARRVSVESVVLAWSETWQHSKRLVSFGLVFMSSGLLAAAVALAIRSAIVRNFGLDANGIFQAAWGISGAFAGFILSAMGMDFYPRLTSIAHDHQQANLLVNEQSEIGILLALPGLLVTLAFAPWMMRLFYSAKFLYGAEMLPWFVLGIYGQVISWPMGYALAAKGASGWYFTAELFANILRLSLSLVLLERFGLWGTALALPLVYIAYTSVLLWICHRLTGFRWNSSCLKLQGVSSSLIFAGFVAQGWLTGYNRLLVGGLLTLIGSLFCLRGIATRLGTGNRFIKMACKIPGFRLSCGIGS